LGNGIFISLQIGQLGVVGAQNNARKIFSDMEISNPNYYACLKVS
jgi:hypothetical protein